MSNKKLFALLLWASFATTAASATPPPNPSGLTCPNTASVGSQIYVSGAITNKSCFNPLIIENLLYSIVSTIGGVPNVQGPRYTPFSATIPASTCNQYGQVISESSVPFSNLPVVTGVVPQTMSGKLVVVNVSALDANNKIVSGSSCNIRIGNIN